MVLLNDMMYSKNMSLPFGQYKGVLLADVLEVDPGYLLWCMENVKGFDLHNSIYQEAYDAVHRDATEREYINIMNY